MTSQELREKFFQFFIDKGHKKVEPSGLVPENDPSVLFTTAGMQQFVPFLLGEKHPLGDKLVDIQPCLRTDDIDKVGDETHLTFFEMMGFWSLGAYWKKEAIDYTLDFYTNVLGLDKNKIGITCFEGDESVNIPKDRESADIWQSLGISPKRISFLGYKDNFWGPTGETGPCGPDTEIFYWTGEGNGPEVLDVSDEMWVEIGNDVFMSYQKDSEGKYELLEQKNVDFGAGFDRLVSIIERKDFFETDLFLPIIDEINKVSNFPYEERKKEFRIIADHIKAAVFAISSGVIPSNKDKGYIVRRLIRRAVVKATLLGIEANFTKQVGEKVIKAYLEYELKSETLNELEKEEIKFRNTLRQGIKHLESKKELSGKDLFDLYQTYGMPIEVSLEEAKSLGISIMENAQKDFTQELKNHQDLSRTASAGMFKSGLAVTSETATKYHTATHLLQAALRKILGDHVVQRGSNITEERLRFDFSHPAPLTKEEIEKVENLVNEQIQADLPVNKKVMSLQDAKNCGALGEFEKKYGLDVNVFFMGDFSKEICAGPHVEHTGVLGHFKIIKEESSSAGVRRIKAILD